MYQTLSESAFFCRRYDKNILVCFFWFTVLTAVHLQNANAKFHKVGKDIIQLRRKTFTCLYDKFTQDNMQQILSQSVRFCRLYIRKHLCFFRFTVYSLCQKHGQRIITRYTRRFPQSYVHQICNRYALFEEYSGSTGVSQLSGK